MLYFRVSTPDDILNIKENEYLDTPKDIIIKILPQIKSWTILNNLKIVAIIVAREFFKNYYSVGIIICKDITISELKFLKKCVGEITKNQGAEYVYSEGPTHKIKDRFHEFMGFHIEKDLGNYKKWEYK